ncbi:MAG: type II secretion system protein [Candidatus Brocadiia bacterium]
MKRKRIAFTLIELLVVIAITTSSSIKANPVSPCGFAASSKISLEHRITVAHTSYRRVCSAVKTHPSGRSPSKTAGRPTAGPPQVQFRPLVAGSAELESQSPRADWTSAGGWSSERGP